MQHLPANAEAGQAMPDWATASIGIYKTQGQEKIWLGLWRLSYLATAHTAHTESWDWGRLCWTEQQQPSAYM